MIVLAELTKTIEKKEGIVVLAKIFDLHIGGLKSKNNSGGYKKSLGKYDIPFWCSREVWEKCKKNWSPGEKKKIYFNLSAWGDYGKLILYGLVGANTKKRTIESWKPSTEVDIEKL
jgi:hypothetical protein